ncbi:hypothetical protein CA2559_03190 [Croceibacter atlanticus HTCC2559]|uniref:Uncharacterized protein n=1 Tax=Croceibacter atlanticus (strain ATCC BAA-628 / JCM 21780 / CIP 108009 / IAM 15332 / KCTC 12090 / HTCC2559) TaxID=216432 RepID=A3U660_CROAH|nr:hypothetical protein CA2559_03190 [Croceibacter atlanticus HTCC2559]|tara:strand:+ start:1429 stop:1569 length:141 start_codon:yes stop_codon:yes gene_type:complete
MFHILINLIFKVLIANKSKRLQLIIKDICNKIFLMPLTSEALIYLK